MTCPILLHHDATAAAAARVRAQVVAAVAVPKLYPNATPWSMGIFGTTDRHPRRLPLRTH